MIACARLHKQSFRVPIGLQSFLATHAALSAAGGLATLAIVRPCAAFVGAVVAVARRASVGDALVHGGLVAPLVVVAAAVTIGWFWDFARLLVIGCHDVYIFRL